MAFYNVYLNFIICAFEDALHRARRSPSYAIAIIVYL
jgi:hypothetical protein